MANLKCEGEVAKQCSDAERIHTTVPSAFEFPDSPRTRIKFPRGNDRNGWDWLDDDLKRDLKDILKRRFHEVLHWLYLWKVLGEIRVRCWKTARQTAKIKTATRIWVIERWEEGAPSSVEERLGGWKNWSFSVVGRVEGTCEEPSPCRGY